jgi:hypothetical protein
VTRISEEKASELQQINRRNEMLILQMCDAHKSEVRCLRDRILELEKQTKEFKLLTHFNFAGLQD